MGASISTDDPSTSKTEKTAGGVVDRPGDAEQDALSERNVGQNSVFASSLFAEYAPLRNRRKLVEMPEEPAADELEPPTDEPEPLAQVEVAQAPSAPACPRCQATLIDPHGLGWCQACGYCSSLEADRGKVDVANPVTARKASRVGLLEFVYLLASLPHWFWVLTFGLAWIFAVTYFCSRSLHLGDSLTRTVWCTAQVTLGLVAFWATQAYALAFCAAEDERLNIKDAFFSVRLWTRLCRKLPLTRWQIWLAAWSLGAVFAALIFVGGMLHWLKYLPNSQIASPPPPAAKK